MSRRRELLAVAPALALANPALAGRTINGTTRVIDGDTVAVSGVTIRLKGVDASEAGTPRGDAATRAMRVLVNGGSLSCTLTGEKTWGREVGFCRNAVELDINRAIIERGFALSCPRYSTRYVRFERPEVLLMQSRANYCVPR